MAGSIVVGLLSAGAAVSERNSSKAQLKAQEKEGDIQRRVADIESQRRARRAVAARRIQQGEIIAQERSFGQTTTNSAVQGAVGSLTTQAAANIGAANTRLAAQSARFSVLQRGAQRAGKFNNIAAGLGVLGSAAGSAGGQRFINNIGRKSGT